MERTRGDPREWDRELEERKQHKKRRDYSPSSRSRHEVELRLARDGHRNREEGRDSWGLKKKKKYHDDDEEYEYGTGRKLSEVPPKSDSDDEDRKEKKKKKEEDPDKERPTMELSGKLSEEQRMTSVGTLLKFVEPPEAARPTKKWKLFVFKGDEALDPIRIHSNTVYLFGRDRSVCDIPLDHNSCSKQHAVIQYRAVEVKDRERGAVKVIKPYLMDLQSTNGTYLNGERIEDSRYYELIEKDVIKFGYSSRDYVILHDQLV